MVPVRNRRCIFLWSLLLTSIGCSTEVPAPSQAPPKVTVAQVGERQDLFDYQYYNGWLEAAKTVDVRARVRGHIVKVCFSDGQLVKEDQLLFVLDPEPFQAETQRAREQLKIFEAQQVAAAKNAAIKRKLLEKGGASQLEVDKTEADLKSCEAQIAATKEEIKRHELDEKYANITAPIAGKIGKAQLTEGNLVNAGGSDPLLATIRAIDPIFIYFSVDERTWLQLKASQKHFDFGLETDDGFPNRNVELDFTDNRIDPGTGTLQVRGQIANKDGRFIPGSRARIRFPVRGPYQALVVPDTAILSDQDRKFVLTVNDKQVVVKRDVNLGKLLDDGMRALLPAAREGEGLKKGDWIIVEGLQRARINYPVDPVDEAGKPVAVSAKKA